MVQRINLNQNNSFINRMQSPLLCEKSGAIATQHAGRQSDKILEDLKFTLLGFSQHLSITNALSKVLL